MNFRAKNLFVFLFLILVFGCKKNDEYDPHGDLNGIKTLYQTGGTLVAPNTSSLKFPDRQMVITNDTDWKVFVSKIENRDANNALSAQQIDFSKYQILAVFDIVRHSTNFHITIQDLVELPDHVKVTVITSNNGWGVAGAALTQPAHIVLIKKTNKPIRFN